MFAYIAQLNMLITFDRIPGSDRKSGKGSGKASTGVNAKTPKGEVTAVAYVGHKRSATTTKEVIELYVLSHCSVCPITDCVICSSDDAPSDVGL